MSSRPAALRLAAALLVGASLAHAQPSPSPAGWVAFEANWSAAGRQHTLVMGERRASTFELSGPFVVTSGEGLSRGFRAEAIGFVERGVLGVGRLVLTDDRGDQIFHDLAGQSIGTGRKIVGTITGGTGRCAGLEPTWRSSPCTSPIHYLFVSQASQVLALFGVFLDVGMRGGVPPAVMAFALLFASSYFSVITPQGGSQNVIFVGSGYLPQAELYRLGALVTACSFLVFLLVGTPWLLLVAR